MVFLISIAIFVSERLVAQENASKEFASQTFDIGVVVSDVRKAVAFYTNAIGFKEVKGFSVPADWTRDVGLTDGKKLDIHVLVLGEGNTATKLKLMEVPGARIPKGNNQQVTSQLGMRYTTIQVTDMDAALDRLKRAGVKPDTKGGMIALPAGFPEGIFLTLVRDPDGNMIELVGPRKSR
jgi:catechol 2,3-dioxygenase-like lactoylglutathione lyase family enzyme